ncbi:IS3 family transposase [Aquicella siphonis]|nr:IS3 family transposase [Aquicella siphonis]
MTISNTIEPVEIYSNTQRRKRWSAIEKHKIVQETYQPGATVSYIARKHGIPPSQLFYWRKVMESGALTGIKTEEELVPVSEVNDLKKRIKQLERVLGQKTMDIEILREAVKIGREKKLNLTATIARIGRFGLRAIARALQVARSNIMEKLKKMKKHITRYNPQEDEALLPYIREIADQRGSYGYRRITTLLNHRLRNEGKNTVNHKRVYRIMKLNKLLLPAYGKKPSRIHDGKIITLRSNTRWCSDAFSIQCQNGDRVFVAFAMDTCDREVLGYVASTIGIDGEAIRDLMTECVEHRFGKVDRLPRPIQWLTDNGPCYVSHDTVKFARTLGFDVCTTPSYSPESNGMAEAFVKTFKRDYASLDKLENMHDVMSKLSRWFDDYNENAPHQGLKMMSPRQFLRAANGN